MTIENDEFLTCQKIHLTLSLSSIFNYNFIGKEQSFDKLFTPNESKRLMKPPLHLQNCLLLGKVGKKFC